MPKPSTCIFIVCALIFTTSANPIALVLGIWSGYHAFVKGRI